MILSNNQSSEPLWVRDMCLVVGLSSLNNHLDYCFIIFEIFEQGAEVRKFCVCGNMIDSDQFETISVGVFLRCGVGAFS